MEEKTTSIIEDHATWAKLGLQKLTKELGKLGKIWRIL